MGLHQADGQPVRGPGNEPCAVTVEPQLLARVRSNVQMPSAGALGVNTRAKLRGVEEARWSGRHGRANVARLTDITAELSDGGEELAGSGRGQLVSVAAG